MAKIEFNIRRMKTGEIAGVEFPDVAAAESWLVQRPAFVQVLRITSEVEPDVEARLRQAMRPLDDEERQSQIEAELKVEAQRIEEIARLQEEKDTAPKDPDRQMVVRWDPHEGLRLVDPAEDREISELARRAVLDWVAERDTWVHDRGQRVAAATVTVWPGPIPSGDEDRVAPGGKFVTGSRPSDA